MKRLSYRTPNHPIRLQAALEEAIPSLAPKIDPNLFNPETRQMGAPVATYTLASDGDDLLLTVPDEADEKAIMVVIASHDPTPDPVLEPETPPTEILLALLADVTDVDETKPILEAMLMILGGQA